MTLAARHRMVPMVSRHLQAHAAGIVGADAMALLRHASMVVAARALDSARELVRVLRALEIARVRALPYKGPALAQAAYGDVGLRACLDLDIVVEPVALDRARAVFAELGYRSPGQMSAAQEGAIYGGQGHIPYVHDGRLAELHWRFAATRFPWNPPLPDIFDRAATTRLAGARIVVPAPPDLVLLLALHGTRHLWEELEWVTALAALVRHTLAEMPAILARASATGGRRALLVGLEVGRRALGAPLPAWVTLAAAQDTAIGPLVDESLARLFRGPSGTPLQRHNSRAFYLRCLERPADRLRFVVQSALRPTPREWETMRLPGALTPLYVPVRLGRLLLRR